MYLIKWTLLVQLSGLTTSATVPLPARAAVLLNGSSLGKLLGHLVFQTGNSDQEALLVDGLLQSLDISLNLLLHALSEAAEIATPWLWVNKTYCVTVTSTQQTLTACVLDKISHYYVLYIRLHALTNDKYDI